MIENLFHSNICYNITIRFNKFQIFKFYERVRISNDKSKIVIGRVKSHFGFASFGVEFKISL